MKLITDEMKGFLANSSMIRKMFEAGIELRKQSFILALIPRRIKGCVRLANRSKRVHGIIAKTAADIADHLLYRHFILIHILSEDRDGAFCRDKPQDPFERCAFPCTVPANEPDDMPLRHAKTDLIKREFGIDFRQSFNFQRIHFCSPSFT